MQLSPFLCLSLDYAQGRSDIRGRSGKNHSSFVKPKFRIRKSLSRQFSLTLIQVCR